MRSLSSQISRLHGQLSDPLHGAIQFRLHRIALALLERGVDPAGRFLTPLLEPEDLYAQLARQKLPPARHAKAAERPHACAPPSIAGQVPAGLPAKPGLGKTWTSLARPHLPQAHQQQLSLQNYRSCLRSSLDTSIKPILCPRKSGPTQVQQKQPKRGRLWLNDGSCIRLRPCWPNHVWSYDFVMDRTHDGRKFRMLTVIDEFTRRCMAVVVERRLNSDNVLHCLTELFVQHGPPDHIRSDNGSEFTAHAVRGLARQDRRQDPLYRARAPWENGYNESFNSKLRDEILNTEIFSTLKEAKVLIERWRHHYNTIRPHSSLGYRPPAPETILPNVEGPTYAVDGLRLAHQLNPRQTLT